MKELRLECRWVAVIVRIGRPSKVRHLRWQRYHIASRRHTAGLRREMLDRICKALKG